MNRYCLLILLVLMTTVSGFTTKGDEDYLYKVKITPGSIDPDKVFLLIDKSDYRMYLYEDVTLRKIYKVVFGSKDQSPKRREGDRLTPEGTFHILSKRVDKQWNRFMLLDYPNEETMAKFRQMQQNGEMPAGATPGGGIGIHGVEWNSGIRDNYVDGRINWTLGCVSMKNADVSELYDIIKIGTPVVIRR